MSWSTDTDTHTHTHTHTLALYKLHCQICRAPNFRKNFRQVVLVERKRAERGGREERRGGEEAWWPGRTQRDRDRDESIVNFAFPHTLKRAVWGRSLTRQRAASSHRDPGYCVKMSSRVPSQARERRLGQLLSPTSSPWFPDIPIGYARSSLKKYCAICPNTTQLWMSKWLTLLHPTNQHPPSTFTPLRINKKINRRVRQPQGGNVCTKYSNEGGRMGMQKTCCWGQCVFFPSSLLPFSCEDPG